MASDRIAFVCPRFAGDGAVGGAETLLKNLATHAAARGWAVDFLTTCAQSHYTWENALPPGRRDMDGGALMNQSIHHIDALQWMMGDEVESVFSFTGTLAHKMESEDTGVAVIKFKNGAMASVEGSTITYPQNLEGSVAVFGEKGSIKVGGTALNRKVFWKVEGELEQEKEMMTREQLDPPSVYGFSHRSVMQDMIDAILTDRQPATNGLEGRKSVALVLAMYRSAETGQPVRMVEDGWHKSD